MSIGEKERSRATAHTTNDGRRSRVPDLMKSRPYLMQSTQLAIKKGRLTNRKASKQKQDEESNRRPSPTVLIACTTFEDRVGEAILRSINGSQLADPGETPCIGT